MCASEVGAYLSGALLGATFHGQMHYPTPSFMGDTTLNTMTLGAYVECCYTESHLC